MRKLRTLLKGPVLTQSGYGIHSRQLFNALFDDELFDLYVEPIKWGHTPFLTRETEEKEKILQCVQKFSQAEQANQKHYDLFIHVTIPNEFEKKGRFNVGVTAGIETDTISHVWIQKCNEMDLIIVPSNHSKEVLENGRAVWQNQQTGESGGLKIEKPIVICNEGVDTGIFNPTNKLWDNKVTDLELEADFNFLHVGQWGQGGYGEDRKNISNLVKYFIETFKGRKDVGLVLKTNMARNNESDYETVLLRLKQIKANFPEDEVPPIHLVHGNLSNEEMLSLYRHPKIKSFISLTHGEGFGLPLLEAAACGLPILATNWSGHLDFLKFKKFSAIEYELKPIPDSAVWGDILIKGSRWAEVKEEETKHRMKKMVNSYTTPKEWANDLAKSVQENFSLEVVQRHFVDVVKMGLSQASASSQVDPEEFLKNFVDTPNAYNVLYTMPRSTGDVFISTAVIDGLKKELPGDAKIYFATSPQYADLLKGNKHIHKVIPWNQSMMNMDLTEKVFDLVMTPDTSTQYTFSNWIRRGQGRLLAEEFANHCQCELGDYHIEFEDIEEGTPDVPYMTFHPGSGKGQWEARRYEDWKEALLNIKKFYPEIKVVQIGSSDEPLYDESDFDFRGKTNYQQTATLVKASKLHLSIDTFTMHLAAALDTPLVALFGCSYATSTGPWYRHREGSKYVLLQSERFSGCRDKACYKNKCVANPDYPPINEIDPKEVVSACSLWLDKEKKGEFTKNEEHEYERVYNKISGYTTTFNIDGYPFVESIKSMLGFCDEVVVVDGCSDDGTYEKLEKLSAEDDRIKLYQIPWDMKEPGMDGMMKANARGLCENDFLWQQDSDEIVHEDDYEKIKMITKRFPRNADILHLPIIELWGDSEHVTGRRHAWKWRMSRNKPEITHGINANARLTSKETGKVYAKEGMSDGCEYIDAMSNQMLNHTGFYSTHVEAMRIQDPSGYEQLMNQAFEQLPSVFHYSWCSLPNKINQFKNKWDKQWNILYQTENIERFSNINSEDEIQKLSNHLFEQGGEDQDQVKYKFKLRKPNPAIMKEWLKKMFSKNKAAA